MRGDDGGFTLVEVLIALVLFSLIGIAGFSLLNAVVGVQSRTDGRLERLAALQRAMQVLSLDFGQVADPPISFENGAATIRRWTLRAGAQTILVRYDLQNGTLTRTLSPGTGATEQAQTLIAGVKDLRWSFFDGGAWITTWPPAGIGGEKRLPGAVALEVTVEAQRGGLGGTLRRVIRLPVEAIP